MISRTLVIDALGYKKNKAFGYQEYLFNLLNYFYENREQLLFDKIIIVCISSQVVDFDKYKGRFDVYGLKVSNIVTRLFAQQIFPYKLKLSRQDTILFTGNYSALFKSCAHVLVIHDLLYIRKKYFPYFFMRIQRKIYIPRSVSIANAVIAISDFTKNDIINNIKGSFPQKIHKVYNYFDFDKFSKVDVNQERIVREKYFLSVSSSSFHKNTITILKAYLNYSKQSASTHLCLVGSLNNNEDVYSFYNRLDEKIKNRIHIFKNISNVELRNLYENCEAYISSTLFEGLGMPIVEAMYFNVPVILSDIDICREISDNNAIFFNPDSADELSHIMIKFKKEKVKSREFVLDKFSEKNTSERYLEIINEIY